MSNLIHNERIKLMATYWNNLAVGVFLGGILVPTVGFISSNKIDHTYAITFVGVGLVASAVMSQGGVWMLRHLRE